MIADFRIKTGDYGEARIWLDQALDIVPEYYLVFGYLAEVERREGDLKAARAFLRKGVDRVRTPESMLRLADMETETGNDVAAETLRDLAIAQLEVATAEGGQGHLRVLAEALLDRGEAPRALLMAAQDLELRQNYQAHATMARALSANGEHLHACVYMNGAVAGHPLDPELYISALEIYGAYGDGEASEAARQTAIRINPRLGEK